MSDDQVSTPGTGVYGADDSSVYLLPIEPICLDCRGNNIRITERTNMKWHEPIEMKKLPSGLPNFNTDSNPQNIKKRDYYFFANDYGSSEKIITVCYLRCKEIGKYTPVTKRQDVSPHKSNIISSYKLMFSEGNELVNDGFKFEFKYFLAGNEYGIGNEGISFTKSDFEHFTLKIKVKIIKTSKSNIPKENKPFHITATVTKPIEGGDPIQEKKEMELIYSPYQGWTLTKDGELKQGKTGWLFDENGLYILEDGRRVDESIMKTKKNKENKIKIGNDDSAKGLNTILGFPNDSTPKIELEYNSEALLNFRGPFLTEVAYQAFQINMGYELLKKGLVIDKPAVWKKHIRSTSQSKLPEPFSFCDYSFGVIGKDETGIPIMVTRVGNENAQKKIVIASPHGDERNAQRLIMVTQKHFLQNRSPVDTVIYFIPCLSPTMAFADVRGVLNQFWKTPMIPPFELDTGKAIISELHEKIKYNERFALQHNQVNQRKPNIGVDANRDYYFSFPSSKCFADFIKTLTGVDIMKGIGTYNGSCTVFMIHGYDSTKAPNKKSTQGSVYGQYRVVNNIGTIQDEIKRYIDFISQSLFGYINTKSGEKNNNSQYFYKNSDNVSEFEGEWIRHLYGETGTLKILAFDIELGETYRQETRGDKYDPDKVGKKELPFFNNQNGFIVEEVYRISEGKIKNDVTEKEYEYNTTSFFEFLFKFYEIKGRIDNEILFSKKKEKK